MSSIDELKRLYAYLQDCDAQFAIEHEQAALAKLRKLLGLEGVGLSIDELLQAAEQVLEGEADLPEQPK